MDSIVTVAMCKQSPNYDCYNANRSNACKYGDIDMNVAKAHES